MTNLNLSARVLGKFPARVAAGAGMLITKLNGIWTFAVDGGNLVPQGSVPDPANTYVLVQLPDGTTAKVPLSVALAVTQPVEFPGKKNFLFNGGMIVWQRGGSPTPGTAGTRTYGPDRWAITSAGAALTTIARNNHAAIPPRSGSMMVIVGNAGVTTVDVDQRVEAATPVAGTFTLNNPLVWAPQIAFSAYINNQTGSAFTPTLFVETPTVLDNWAASTIVNGGGAGEALQSCPNGVWTRVTWLGDPAAYANKGNGIGFRLRFPSGSLDSNGKSVWITDVMCEPRYAADGIFSQFEVMDFGTELIRCQRYYQKTFPYSVKPAQNAGASNALYFTQVVGAATVQGGNIWRLPTKLRTSPATGTLYNPAAVNAQARNETVLTDCTGTSINLIYEDTVIFACTTAAGSAAGNRMQIHITLDMEL